MAVADVMKFRDALSKDAGLQKSLDAEIAGTKGSDPKERTMSSLIAVGGRSGFSFTRAELDQAVEDMELSPAELEKIAGGGS